MLIPFALDLCESEMQDIKKLAPKDFAEKRRAMNRIYKNLQIAKTVIDNDGYGDPRNKERYIAVRRVFCALQLEHGINFDDMVFFGPINAKNRPGRPVRRRRRGP